jgi:protein-S-isoprenylcysteine O-methyltransferase Ste14
MTKPPWYRNARGEAFLVVQAVLLALLAFGPRSHPALPPWVEPWSNFARGVGLLLLCAGGLLALAGAWQLGRNLTPLAAPRAGAPLVVSGAYRLVRHPIYGGLVLFAFGWGCWVRGWLTLAWALLLFLVLDRKATLEEVWLAEAFAAYGAYRRRVRKLIPFVY